MPADTPLPAELEEALCAALTDEQDYGGDPSYLRDEARVSSTARLYTLLSRIVAERDEARKERDRAVEALVDTLSVVGGVTTGAKRPYLKRDGETGDCSIWRDGRETFVGSPVEAVAALLKEGA